MDCDYMGSADSLGYNYGNRAMAAYFREAKKYRDSPDQPTTPEAFEVEGRLYIVLSNANGILAVYRVKNDGVLRRLKRYPTCLEQV